MIEARRIRAGLPKPKSTWDKLLASANAIVMNVGSKVGFGIGIGLGAQVFNAGPKIGVKLDAFQIRTDPKILSNGALPAGMDLAWGASAFAGLGPAPLSWDAGIGSSTTSQGELEINETFGNEFTIADVEAYCIIGFSMEITYDIEGLYEDFAEIWE